MRLECAERTHVGLVREMNQDSLATFPDHGVYIVADGMGGEMAGDEASAQVIATAKAAVKAFFKSTPHGPSELETMMRDTLLEANHEVFQISVREPHKRGLGSTASMLALYRGIYFTAQVGDSRIYLARGGKVQQITRDHTLVWDLYEKGMITRDQLETHPERHLLTQCIGNERSPQVETREGRAQEHDLFLICSDGLTGYASETKVFEILLEPSLTLDQKTELLINAALEAGGGDNVSAVLVRVAGMDATDNWEPEATAESTRFDTTGVDDTIIDEVRGQMGRKSKKGANPVLLLALILVVAAAAGMLLLMPKKVPLQLTGDPLPDEITVEATRDGKPIGSPALDIPAREVSLPGPGEYILTFRRPRYLPLERKVKILGDGPAKVALDHWIELSRLAIKFPDHPKVTSLLVRTDEGNPTRTILNSSAEQLDGKQSIDVDIEPDTRHMIIAKAESLEFTDPEICRPGESRTVEIRFQEAAAAP